MIAVLYRMGTLMRVSHKYNFLFLANPRTGTTSIKDRLVRYADTINSSTKPYGEDHISALDARALFQKNGWDWSSYFKFAFVRNPWDLEVSQYHYHFRQLVALFGKHKEEKKLPESFNEFIEGKNDLRAIPGPQVNFISDENEAVLLDFVGRYENLKSDWKTICNKIKIPAELPRINTTNHRHYSEYYSKKTESIVAEWYKKDIKKFGYKFEKPPYIKRTAFNIAKPLFDKTGIITYSRKYALLKRLLALLYQTSK